MSTRTPGRLVRRTADGRRQTTGSTRIQLLYVPPTSVRPIDRCSHAADMGGPGAEPARAFYMWCSLLRPTFLGLGDDPPVTTPRILCQAPALQNCGGPDVGHRGTERVLFMKERPYVHHTSIAVYYVHQTWSWPQREAICDTSLRSNDLRANRFEGPALTLCVPECDWSMIV